MKVHAVSNTSVALTMCFIRFTPPVNFTTRYYHMPILQMRKTINRDMDIYPPSCLAVPLWKRRTLWRLALSFSSDTTPTYFNSIWAISSPQMSGISTQVSASPLTSPSLCESRVLEEAPVGLTLKVIAWITDLLLSLASIKAPVTTLLLSRDVELCADNNSSFFNK